MKRIFTIYSIFYSFLISIPILGMEASESLKRGRDESYSPVMHYQKRNKTLIDAIDALQEGSSVKLESPFFSNPKLCDALIDAVDRGVDIELHTTSRARFSRKKLDKAGIPVTYIPGLHAKRCLIRSGHEQNENRGENGSPRKKKSTSEPQYTTYVGSDNMTIFSQFHREVLAEIPGKSYYDQQKDLYVEYEECKTPLISPLKAIIKKTPNEPTVVSTHNTRVNAGKARCLNKLFDDMHANERNVVDFTSMTFNSEDIVEKVEELFAECPVGKEPTVRLFLDASAAKHPALLDRMKKAGGDKVNIYIFNQDRGKLIFKKFPQLQHTKTMIRRCPKAGHIDDDTCDDYLAIVSTGNLTKNSGRELNIDSYHPEAEGLFTEIRMFNDILEKECEEYVLKSDTTS